MKQKLKRYKQFLTKLITKFGDIRFSGQIIFGVLVFLITWSGIKAIQSNYNLMRQETNLKNQNQVASLQNSTLALQNEYYKSSQYLELSARQYFGLALPGEQELLVSKNVALSYTVTPPNFATSSESSPTVGQHSNYLSWLDFFLHRNPSK